MMSLIDDLLSIAFELNPQQQQGNTLVESVLTIYGEIIRYLPVEEQILLGNGAIRKYQRIKVCGSWSGVPYIFPCN